ncbi:hypothetical protein BKI52_09495 [marine bacterium AO1-C]|nr:hypothetical protein BKI52_09495 [marine bacterium AO1-C]
MKKLLLVLLFVTHWVALSWAQKSSETLIAKIDELVNAKMSAYKIPGLAIGVVKNGQLIYAKGYGVKNIKTQEKVDKNTVFHLASISKLITAEAIMLLVQKGALRLEDKLVKVIPELKFSDERIKTITIQQLLNHTSGLPDVRGYNWGNKNQAPNALANHVKKLKLRLKYPPGTKLYYSNLGYDILARVVERASGEMFEDYVKTNILVKAGMKYSDFRYFKIPANLRCSPHSQRRVSGQVYVRKTYPYNRVHAGSSTLNASAVDMCLWMSYFLKALQNNTNYQKMLQPSFTAYPRIGLGFQLGKVGNKMKAGHYGGDKGFRSYLMLIPEKNIGLVLMGNCDYKEDYRQEILHPIAKMMLKK